VHDRGFCATYEFYVPASQVMSSGRVCSCQDILDYPSLIGVCDSGGKLYTPMVVEGDCVGGNAVCPSESANTRENTFLVGDTNTPFTACDLACDFTDGHVINPSGKTYHGCEFPEFAWTVSTTSPNGSMDAHQLEILGDTLFVGGSIWSFDTVDTTTPTTFDFQLKGPFTADDPIGSSGTVIDHMVQEYDEKRQYECAVAMIDKVTGKPLQVISIVGPGTCYINAMGKNGDGTILAAGGDYAPEGSLKVATSICTPVENGEGGSYTSCSADGHTTLHAHDLAYTGHVFYMHPDGTVRWLIQPWLILKSELADQGFAWFELSVTGVSVDDEGDVYVTGYRATSEGEIVNPGNGTPQPNIVYYAMLTKLSGVNGSVIWEKEFKGAQHTLHSAYDSSQNALFVTAEVKLGTEKVDGLGITCDHEQVDEVEGCNILMRVSAVDGEVDWVRYAYGFFGRPRNHGDVQLAHPDDGAYVYASFTGVGYHGPTNLDLGTPYAGCKNSEGFIVPSFKLIFSDLVTEFSQKICDAFGAGTFFNNTSEDAVPAYAANSLATCGGSTGVHCIAKYHKLTGLPVWGSAKPLIFGFKPQSDGIIVVGSNYGPATFDRTTVSGPIGVLDGYDMVFQSKLDLEGNGIYVQSIIADRSYAAGAGLTEDPANNNIYFAFYTTTDLTYLGPGAPGGFIQDLQTDTCGELDAICEGDIRTTVALLGEPTKPSCIDSCDISEGKHTIATGQCFIDQVCYQNGDTASRIGMACMQCNPAKSQTEWSESSALGVDFCLIDELCYRYGDPLSVRVGRLDFLDSKCQICSPTENIYDWSVRQEYTFVDSQDPPDDCILITVSPAKSPTSIKLPTKSPTKSSPKSPTSIKLPTKSPIKLPTKSPIKLPTKSPTKSRLKSPTKSRPKSPTKSPVHGHNKDRLKDSAVSGRFGDVFVFIGGVVTSALIVLITV